MCDLAFNEGDIFGNIRVIDWKLSVVAVHIEGLLFAALFQQPQRRFAYEGDTNGQQASRDELDSKWNKPLFMVDGKSLADTVVDIEADQAASLPAKLIDTNQAATNRRG